MNTPRKSTIGTLASGFAAATYGVALREPSVWIVGGVVVLVGVSLWTTRDQADEGKTYGIVVKGLSKGVVSGNKTYGYEDGIYVEELGEVDVIDNESHRGPATPNPEGRAPNDKDAPPTER